MASSTTPPGRSETPPMRPDIRQVAAEAGVSTATVSRVLTGRGPASAEATRRVRDAAQRLGYSPSAPASSLRTERSMIIGVLIPNLANPVFLPFLRAVEHLAQHHGYAVIVADSQRSPEVERRQLDRLGNQRIDALVVAGRARDPGYIRRLAESGLAVADAESFVDQAQAVAASQADAIDRACEQLAHLGHRHLCYLARGGAALDTPQGRWPLIEAAARARGMEARSVQVGALADPDRPDVPGTAALLEDLVRSPGGATALWSASHTLAPHLLEGLGVVEVAIPAECSFLTFGDSTWASAYRPAIAVVTTDVGALGAVMTEDLLYRMGVLDSAPDPVPDTDRYVPRASVGPASPA